MIKVRSESAPLTIRARTILSAFYLVLAVSLMNIVPDRAECRESGMGGKNPVIARVGETTITVQDIEDKQINDLRAELYKRLLGKMQLQALQQLAKTHPEYSLSFQPEISDQEIRDFYQANNLQNRGSLESLKTRIMALLQMKAISDHYNRLYAKALKKGLIVSYLTEPNDFLIRSPIGTAYVWEKGQEAVMVLEYSDYQCPFCSRIQSTLLELRQRYSGRVAFGYRHAPLEFHTEADEAAIAAECARDQGKFPEYHKALFSNYRQITPGSFERFAREAGVSNIKRFNACVSSEKYRSRVEADQKAALEAGIRGTPGFIIGTYDRKKGLVFGELLSGAQPRSAFIELIEKYITKK